MVELEWEALDNCVKRHHKKYHLDSCANQNGLKCKCKKEDYVCENIFFRDVMKWKRHWQTQKATPAVHGKPELVNPMSAKRGPF